MPQKQLSLLHLALLSGFLAAGPASCVLGKAPAYVTDRGTAFSFVGGYYQTSDIANMEEAWRAVLEAVLELGLRPISQYRDGSVSRLNVLDQQGRRITVRISRQGRRGTLIRLRMTPGRDTEFMGIVMHTIGNRLRANRRDIVCRY
jgi:hypothetical protein